MGLTIHYTLSLKQDVSPGVIRELARRTADYARKIGCARASEPKRAEENEDLAPFFFPVGKQKKNEGTFSGVGPKHGWLVEVWPGEGCESAEFGLCQYAKRVRIGGRHVATGFKGGWQLQSFCKTQYAGQHGWEHFLKCHKQIISLLDFWRGLGVRVKVNDEGGYWESRSEEKLRAELVGYDRLVAAMGGMFKDSGNGLTVESPIFDYKNFERLEHEGQKQYGGKIRQFKQLSGIK
jgi:hypothetical protein